MSESHEAQMEQDRLEHEAYMKEIKAKYTTILENQDKKYKPKMVGLNPNMTPTYQQSLNKIFPGQGLWSQKKLLVSTTDHMKVPLNEQMEHCSEVKKDHFKKMYKQKEYMEEWLKFKEVIAGMKK